MTVITISRQIGSGGDEIAARVCDLLQYRYFDKRLIVEAAAETGLSESEVIDFSEDRYPVRSFLDRLLRSSSRAVATVSTWHEDTTGKKTLSLRELDAAECINLVRHSILMAYRGGNIVIVGRGGQAILRDQPNTLHLRIIAPFEVRMQRLRDQGMRGVSDIKAAIEQQDRASADYLKHFYNIQWDDPALYDAVINTARLDYESVAQMIVHAVRQRQAELTA